MRCNGGMTHPSNSFLCCSSWPLVSFAWGGRYTAVSCGHNVGGQVTSTPAQKSELHASRIRASTFVLLLLVCVSPCLRMTLPFLVHRAEDTYTLQI